ncbi:ABC transporter permease [Actinosynnema sp. NPDC047251]|uniref:ABC-type di-/oligopeptide transporter, permease subunit n=1 Tax=Saccharothrix espanaensis (strain ATCC 51144 / DSM 44229 / JCM 9112 / NBRC 15066 / NRRL 15764) TaxID=1179773 RepID=K0JQU6_SACES|nr:ABC transporter permease [Saccharothrix espanaensis]CCH28071.1 ABC-type di-/oligopeptide transporter, permease subunit [Saccharothrix espanaensis DSM 44229]
MGFYVLRRLLQMIPVFLGTTFLIYAMVWAVPGDPFAGKCGERDCPPAYIERMRDKFNLDDPLWLQYVKYLGNVLRGDFGETSSGIQVIQQVGATFPVTLRLALVALLIEAVIGITAGVVSGLRNRGFLDSLVLVSTLFLISIPVFVTGYVVQLVFGLQLGWISPTVSTPTWGNLFVPGFVLASLSMAYVARLSRASIAENRRADYVRTALAKGLPQSRVVGVHLLRNSLIPVITFLGTDLGAFLGGAIVTEGIFNVPGVGGLVYRSVLTKDGAMVTGVVTVLVLVYLVMTLLVDLLYAVLDPRIRYD